MTHTEPQPPHHSPEELDNEDVAHEHSDVNIQAILTFGAGLVAVTGASMVAMWLLFNVLDRQAAANEPVLSPLALPDGQLPPSPRLLTDEPGNLEKVLAKEDKRLHGYGWVDQPSGVAHIPIEAAKKKLLERGVPSRPAPADASVGTHAPAMAEGSGGRTIK